MTELLGMEGVFLFAYLLKKKKKVLAQKHEHVWAEWMGVGGKQTWALQCDFSLKVTENKLALFNRMCQLQMTWTISYGIAVFLHLKDPSASEFRYRTSAFNQMYPTLPDSRSSLTWLLVTEEPFSNKPHVTV